MAAGFAINAGLRRALEQEPIDLPEFALSFPWPNPTASSWRATPCVI